VSTQTQGTPPDSGAAGSVAGEAARAVSTGEGQPAGRGFLGRVFAAQAMQIFFVLLVIVAIFGALAPEAFLTFGNFRNIATNVSILSIIAMGMTFVIITAGIDLSVGAVLVFSGVAAAITMNALGGEGWLVSLAGLAVALASGLFWGVFNGVLIAKAKIPPLIVTLGSLGIALGLAQILTGGIDRRDAPTVLVDTVGFGRIFGQIPVLTVIALVVILFCAVLLHRTRFGRHTFAIGSNPEAALRAGIKVDRHLIMVYGMTGLFAGFAGLLNLAFFQSTTIAGQSTANLNAIAAVVIGGTSLFGGIGTIGGTVVGVFIPSVLQNGFVILRVQPFWQQAVVGAVLIAAVYVDQARRSAAVNGRGGNPSPLVRWFRGSRERSLQ
jgi:ribose transport system permease protein